MKKALNKYINEDIELDKTSKIGIICLLIVISGFFGWVYEVIFYFFNSGMKDIYWRGGNFLPWINIYAMGAFLICFLTLKHRKKPLKVFLIGALACGILEFIGGYGVYLFGDGMRCWDYNQEILNFGNICGFVCLRSVLFFGLSGLLLIYFIVPFTIYLSKKMNKKTFLILSVSLCFIFMFDEIYNLLITRILNTPRASVVYKKIGFHYLYFK